MENSNLQKNQINLNVLIQINKIIERDRLSSTYKFALLKATIDAIQKYDHLIKKNNDFVLIPIGLIVENWFFDYLPFVYENIRQQNNGRVLNKEIEELYQLLFDLNYLEQSNWKETYNFIHKKYNYEEFDYEESKIVLNLFKKIAKTITNMPMKYIGETHYSIFKPNDIEWSNIKLSDGDILKRKFIVDNFNFVKIDYDFYTVFKYIGQNLFGLTTIANRWKEITYKLNPNNYLKSKIDEIIFKTFDNRDTNLVRNLLPNECECVWTGKKLLHFDIDHLLPYSVWFNNDLWNLLPCDPSVNRKKGDKIPSPDLIRKRKNSIINYWKIYKEKSNIFNSQIQISLGEYNSFDNFVDSLCSKAAYLIEDRGLDIFNI